MRLLQGIAVLTLLLCQPARVCAAQLHHDLVVSIDPDGAGLEVTDTITLPAGTGTLVFSLHPGLEPELLVEGSRGSEVLDCEADREGPQGHR